MLQRFVDPAAVAAEIKRVRSLSGHALRRRWQSVFGRLAPEHLTADLLRRMIVNRIQEDAFGTLDPRQPQSPRRPCTPRRLPQSRAFIGPAQRHGIERLALRGRAPRWARPA